MDTQDYDELKSRFASMSDAELVAVARADAAQYRPEARLAAENVLRSRGRGVDAPVIAGTLKPATATAVAEVCVRDVSIPFWSLVALLVKIAIAAIPAMIILWLLGMALLAMSAAMAWGC